MKTIIHIIIILSFFPFKLSSQDWNDNDIEIIEKRVDFLLDLNEGGETDFTTLFEQLEVFYKHPINLNNTNKSELKKLGILNDIQINNLLKHIEINGEFLSIEELQSIDSFTLNTIRLITPFVKTAKSLKQNSLFFNSTLKEGSSSLFLRYTRVIEKQIGYINDKASTESSNQQYLGSPDKLFCRYRFNYSNKISIGLTAEKDAGEEFFKGSQKSGFDFYSAHFFAQDIGKIKQIALGDYQAQFGQGLTFWSGLAFGRSPRIFTLKRNAQKIRPYTSVQESQFLRGAAITLSSHYFETTLFYSSKKQDANRIGIDSSSSKAIITSLPQAGFHRTKAELENKNSIKNEFLGVNTSYERRNLNLGFTAVYNKINAIFQPNITTYNQFSSLDNQNTTFGFDFAYLYKNWNLFGEGTKSISGGYAYTLGALAVLDPKFSIGIQHRNFEKNFKPILSNAIGENSTNVNEQALFIGIEAIPHQYLSLSAYADRFSFPWLRFQTDAPSHGSRLFTQLSYQPNKKLESYVRYRRRVKGKNNSTNKGIDKVVVEASSSLRLHFSYQATNSIQIKNRIELNNYQLGNNKKENGFLIYQDIAYKKIGLPHSFSIRYLLFDTDSYHSRIYTYENDVLYAFSIPAFNGSGMRFYLISKYQFNRNVDLWIRYAQTYYTDRKGIGSGKDKITGNTKSEFKAQLRIKF